MKVELLYFDRCPGYEELRPRVQRLLDERGLAAHLTLVPVTSLEEADARRFLGSPSLRVDGRDVDPDARGRRDYGMKCRIYQDAEGLARTPRDELIVAALDQRSLPAPERTGLPVTHLPRLSG